MTAQYKVMCTTAQGNKPLRGCGRHELTSEKRKNFSLVSITINYIVDLAKYQSQSYIYFLYHFCYTHSLQSDSNSYFCILSSLCSRGIPISTPSTVVHISALIWACSNPSSPHNMLNRYRNVILKRH